MGLRLQHYFKVAMGEEIYTRMLLFNAGNYRLWEVLIKRGQNEVAIRLARVYYSEITIYTKAFTTYIRVILYEATPLV
jgi:hypothetical protein